MLKKVFSEEGPHELRISRFFSSPGIARHPRNHCVPLLGVIKIPRTGQKLMVMPLLRPFNNPSFQTFGEFIAFFTQVCEVCFLTNHRRRESINFDVHSIRAFNSCTSKTLHTGGRGRLRMEALSKTFFRDCTANNLMFDPSGMYPQGFHPTQMNRSRDFKCRAMRYTRTQMPPRYYLIDFGLSRQYLSREALDEPLRGGDKSAPEHRYRAPCNPFQTDIYYLGNLVREQFMQVRSAIHSPSHS